MLELVGQAPSFDDPLGMLRACHRRIERALARLTLVAEQEQVSKLSPAAEQALREVLGYFAESVPRHSADEDESLFPRLRAALGGPGEVNDADETAALVASLEHEHTVLDAAHRELDVLGEELLRTGRFASEEDRRRFRQVVDTLRDSYAEHIRREDEQVFPAAARVMSGELIEEVGAEMATRRGIDWNEQRQVVEQMRSRWSRP